MRLHILTVVRPMHPQLSDLLYKHEWNTPGTVKYRNEYLIDESKESCLFLDSFFFAFSLLFLFATLRNDCPDLKHILKHLSWVIRAYICASVENARASRCRPRLRLLGTYVSFVISRRFRAGSRVARVKNVFLKSLKLALDIRYRTKTYVWRWRPMFDSRFGGRAADFQLDIFVRDWDGRLQNLRSGRGHFSTATTAAGRFRRLKLFPLYSQ